jgi:hypothetical protein
MHAGVVSDSTTMGFTLPTDPPYLLAVYAGVGLAILLLLAGLLYVLCSKKYRLNWWHRNLLERGRGKAEEEGEGERGGEERARRVSGNSATQHLLCGSSHEAGPCSAAKGEREGYYSTRELHTGDSSLISGRCNTTGPNTANTSSSSSSSHPFYRLVTNFTIF